MILEKKRETWLIRFSKMVGLCVVGKDSASREYDILQLRNSVYEKAYVSVSSEYLKLHTETISPKNSFEITLPMDESWSSPSKYRQKRGRFVRFRRPKEIGFLVSGYNQELTVTTIIL